MKIVIDARFYGLEHAGLGRYAINLLEQLQRLDKKNTYKVLLQKKYYKMLKFPKNWEKIEVNASHYGLKEQLVLPFIINKLKPDLVHFLHFNIPFFLRGHFLVTIHDMTMHRQKRDASQLPLPLYLAKRIPYKIIFRKAVNDSKHIFVPSEHVKEDVAKHFSIERDKITVTHEGFPKMDEYSGVKASLLRKYKLNSDYFIYVGNAYPHKNLKRAIEALSLLNKDRSKKVLFAIATSKDKFEDRLKKEAKLLNTENFVRFLGFIPQKDLSGLLKNSIAFVYPSLSEGFGLQGLESISAGTLVLASNIPIFKEIYNDKVIYFNPYDFTSIAKTMETSLEMKEEERESFIKRSQKFIKRYSWVKMAKKTYRIYESCNSL